jgi:hypothetical protein
MHETTLASAFAQAKPLTRSQDRKSARTQVAPETNRRMIRVTIESLDPRSGRLLRKATANIATEHAPAFRSAVDEIRGEIGGRLEGKFAFATEQALTDASVAVSAFAAAVNQVVPQGDVHYKTR